MSGLRTLGGIASAAMLATTGAMVAQHPFILPASFVAVAAPAQPMPARRIAPQDVARFVARLTLSLPDFAQAAPELVPDDVAERVREIVPRELSAYFDLYLYVSKAATGPWAQHMVVFHQSDDGALIYEQDFPVSTGRERQEKYFTSTPAGFFELDPDRFDRVHYSRRWHHAPIPWAMFLNYTIRAHPTGVAVHSGIGHESELGHRASGGCVRLPPEKAEELFRRIQSTELGRVPVFAMDETGITTDKTGRLLRDPNGAPVTAVGYRVLLIIEDYPGASVVVATVS